MSEQRFIIRYFAAKGGDYKAPFISGWRVCLDGEVITKAFDDEKEALMRCRNIETLYKRFGWIT